jgi:hypothetical protein
LAAALQSYRVGLGSYPSTATGAGSVNAFLGSENMAFRLPSFSAHAPGPSLTTPTAWISALPTDPFAPSRGACYVYNQGSDRWVIVSAGPDRDYDFDPPCFDPAYKPTWSDILARTYDPSNGTVSNGDIYRMGP